MRIHADPDPQHYFKSIGSGSKYEPNLRILVLRKFLIPNSWIPSEPGSAVLFSEQMNFAQCCVPNTDPYPDPGSRYKHKNPSLEKIPDPKF
jgi:hypothetical protein